MRDLARESAIKVMTDWFLQHYEDPGESTPYDSSEGGYIYIWGGPYDARDVLFDKFGSEFEEVWIETTVAVLEKNCHEWAKIPTLEDYDPEEEPVSEYLARAKISLGNIRVELAEVRSRKRNFMTALLYAHTISVLEAFLSDAFASFLKDPVIFRKYVESEPKFGDEKISIATIYAEMETINAKVTKHLHSIVFHRLEVVQRMFRNTLGVEFPPGMAELLKAVARRHDIIHRNCKSKEGSPFEISLDEVTKLLDLAEAFISELSRRLDGPGSGPTPVACAS